MQVPLYVCVVYLPPANSSWCPTDLASWWLRLEEDVAAAAASGLIILAGHFNAYTGSHPDGPVDRGGQQDCAPRTSVHKAPINRHGAALLTLCSSAGLRLCNGRCGPSSGAVTSFGSQDGGQAVCDYMAVSLELLPYLRGLEVLGWHPASVPTDHASLFLFLELPPWQPQRGAAEQPPPEQQATAPAAEWTPQLRQYKADPERLKAAVAALEELSEQLVALVDAADAVDTVKHLTAVSDWLTEAVCTALSAAGMRELRTGQQRQRQPRTGGLPRHTHKQFGITALRQAQRQADAAGDREQQARLRQAAKKASRQAHKEAERLRGERLETTMRTDIFAFFQPFDRRGKVPCTIPSEKLVQHICCLLGGDTPQPERPPPEPPPTERPPPEPPPTERRQQPAAAAQSTDPTTRAAQHTPAAAAADPPTCASQRAPAAAAADPRLQALEAQLHAPISAADVAGG